MNIKEIRERNVESFIDYIDQEVNEFLAGGSYKRTFIIFNKKRIELSFTPEIVDSMKKLLKTELEIAKGEI